MVLLIREATAADALTVAGLHTRSWRSAYRGILTDRFLDHDVEANRIAIWQQRFAERSADDFRVFIAERDCRAVGFACVCLETPSMVFLDNLHVVPDEKRRGIGRLLITKVARWAIERAPGATLYLWVFEANVSARRFYQMLGGNEVGIEDHRTADGGFRPAIRCEWRQPAVLLSGSEASSAG